MHFDSRVVPWTEAQRVEGRLMVYPPRGEDCAPLADQQRKFICGSQERRKSKSRNGR